MFIYSVVKMQQSAPYLLSLLDLRICMRVVLIDRVFAFGQVLVLQLCWCLAVGCKQTMMVCNLGHVFSLEPQSHELCLRILLCSLMWSDVERLRLGSTRSHC